MKGEDQKGSPALSVLEKQGAPKEKACETGTEAAALILSSVWMNNPIALVVCFNMLYGKCNN